MLLGITCRSARRLGLLREIGGSQKWDLIAVTEDRGTKRLGVGASAAGGGEKAHYEASEADTSARRGRQRRRHAALFFSS